MPSCICEVPDEQLFFYDTKGFPQCVICMDIITDTNKVVLSCNHEYHASCMMENVVHSNNTCPLCREVVSKQAYHLPDLNEDTSISLIKTTFHDEFEHIANDFVNDRLFESFSEHDKGLVKVKMGICMTAFGFSVAKNIKKWIDQGNDRIIPEVQNSEIIQQHHDNDAELFEFIEDYNLEAYSQRIFENNYLNQFENFLNADIETFMWPPGRSLHDENGPLFSRQEAEDIMGAIIRYFSNEMNETD